MAISRPYKKKSPAKRSYKKKPLKVSTSIKAYVHKAITRSAEKKNFFAYGANQQLQSTGFQNWQNLLPRLPQGASQSNRIGNQVKVTKAYVHGFVNLLPYNSVSNTLSTAVLIKIWICKYRQQNLDSFANSYNLNSDFFDVGQANIGFQSSVLDMMLTCNKDDWMWYMTKQFKIGAASATAAGAVGTGGYYDNSPMSQKFYFDYTKHIGKLHYNDSNVQPVNTNLWMVMQAVYADGSSASIAPAEYHFATRIEYEDM